jgi:Transposase DDE domain
LIDVKARREKLAQIAARLKESGRKQTAASEPDCRMMKTTSGLKPAYNAQLTVDAANGVIVAAEVSQQQTDHGLLHGQLQQTAQNVGCRPGMVLADSGYSDEATFQALTECEQEALIPLQENPQEAKRTDPFASRHFVADKQRDSLICPQGRELTFRRVVRCSSGHYRVYTAQDCRDCPFYAECVKVKSKRGRSVQISVVAQQREGMRQKLKMAQGKALFDLRKQTVERVLARLKVNLGFSRFRLPGLTGAGTEWWLICAAHNVLTYARAALAAITHRFLSAPRAPATRSAASPPLSLLLRTLCLAIPNQRSAAFCDSL